MNRQSRPISNIKTGNHRRLDRPPLADPWRVFHNPRKTRYLRLTEDVFIFDCVSNSCQHKRLMLTNPGDRPS